MDDASRPDGWGRRPYRDEVGWTADHQAFRDWLMDELFAAGCEMRTLSALGMAQVTVEHMVRCGWSAARPGEPRSAQIELSSELELLARELASLRGLGRPARLIVEDDRGGRWNIKKAYVIGARTHDPGLVIRLAPQ